MNRYWFRRKTFGLGATPATWEGWAVTAVYCVLVFALSRFFLRSGDITTIKAGVFAGVTIGLTGLLLWIAALKTKGGLGWTWGKRD